ncbi:MAG: hypothetical protein N3A60_03380 [Thermanaerothrix sp.]|nr:hypothetical protein [Thermanaerothrix sp.]
MNGRDLSPQEMIAEARRFLYPRRLGYENTAGSVACALVSASGRLYYGVCIDVSSGIGFCAEHSAIAAMITAGETAIARVVAVAEGGRVLPPCGRCREFMVQIDEGNLERTEVILGETQVVRLRDLLPYPYVEV